MGGRGKHVVNEGGRRKHVAGRPRPTPEGRTKTDLLVLVLARGAEEEGGMAEALFLKQ